jgi:hypothetical protein
MIAWEAAAAQIQNLRISSALYGGLPICHSPGGRRVVLLPQ